MIKKKDIIKYIAVFIGIVFIFFFVPDLPSESPIVTSIKPLHSLVAAIIGETGTPVLLVEGMQSPHGYQLKPSQMQALQSAPIIFYISPDLETFLVQPLKSLPSGARKIALIEAPGVITLKLRAGGVWETHDHKGHNKGQDDPHIWLSVTNAKAMVKKIAEELEKIYPEHKEIYKKNVDTLINDLSALDNELRTQLIPIQNKPYIVFHDAFQYFEKDYGLTAAGSITLEPNQEPGAKRIKNIREKIKTLGVLCVFGEPQFNSRLVRTVIEGTKAKTSVLDALGSDIPESSDLYFTLMRNLANSFAKDLQD